MRIDLTCTECGSNRFGLDKNLDNDSSVKCEDCGHDIGTMADLKRLVALKVLSHSASARGRG